MPFLCCCSLTQSCLTLQFHGLQCARLPCPSLSPSLGSNSCLLSQWCHPTISPSVVPFSSHLQSFPASGSFQKSVLHIRGPVLELQLQHNVYSGLISFRNDWFDLLAVQETLKNLFQHHISKASNLWRSAFFMVQLSHLYMTTGKTTALLYRLLLGDVSAF